MAPTVEIEATSATTARATLTGADVPPMDLAATEDKALAAVVHEFVCTLAVKQQSAVEVIYRTGKDTRFLTVGLDGKLTESAPSVPIPVVAIEPEPAAAEPVTAIPAGPVTVTADPMTFETPAQNISQASQGARRARAGTQSGIEVHTGVRDRSQSRSARRSVRCLRCPRPVWILRSVRLPAAVFADASMRCSGCGSHRRQIRVRCGCAARRHRSVAFCRRARS